jgi:hypothetical protein
VSISYLLVALFAVFAAIGCWRGWLREVGTLAGLLVAWMAVVSVGETLVGLVNRVHLMLVFWLDGGFDSGRADALLYALRQHPAVDPRRPATFLGILFGVLAILAYLAANRFARPVTGTSGRALGALAGLANGYLVIYLGLRYLAPGIRLTIPFVPSTAGAADTLGQYLSAVLVLGVILTIGIALLSSGRLGGKGPGRASGGGRAKSRPSEA